MRLKSYITHADVATDKRLTLLYFTVGNLFAILSMFLVLFLGEEGKEMTRLEDSTELLRSQGANV